MKMGLTGNHVILIVAGLRVILSHGSTANEIPCLNLC